MRHEEAGVRHVQGAQREHVVNKVLKDGEHEVTFMCPRHGQAEGD